MKSILSLSLFVLVNSAYGQEVQAPIEGPCNIVVPSALSPNGSEKLSVHTSCDFDELSFEMYNRWGQLMYSTDRFTDPLDFDMNEMKEVKGKEEYRYQQGVYVWMIKYNLSGPAELSLSGNITIIR